MEPKCRQGLDSQIIALVVFGTALIFAVGVVSVFYLINQEKETLFRPYCGDKGESWGLSDDVLLTYCPKRFVDIRELRDGKTTSRGIRLTLSEWRELLHHG